MAKAPEATHPCCPCVAPLKDELAGAKQALGDLVAVIDRDGGHAQFGESVTESSERAAMIVFNERSDRRRTVMCEENEKRLGMIWNWAHQYGAALNLQRADTYGEGMRDAKDQVKRLLSDALPLADEQALATMRAQRDEARELVRQYVEGDCLYDELNEERACNAVLRWDEEAERW